MDEEKAPDVEDRSPDEQDVTLEDNEPSGPSQEGNPGRDPPARLSSIASSVVRLARKEPTVSKLEDHFSLPTASNLVRFRNRMNAARVYDQGKFQTVLEENYDEVTGKSTVTVKQMKDLTAGTTILRISYTVVTALWTGFFFTFCLQVLLFLVLDLAVESGATEVNAEFHVGATIGVFLAMVTLVISFTEALVIAGHYIVDTWEGQFLIKTFVFKKMSSLAVDWVFCFFFLLCPLCIMCVALLMQQPNWWEITALSWFAFVLGFYILFCFSVVFFEVKAAWSLCKNFCKKRGDAGADDWWHVLKQCFMFRQVYNYSGTQSDSYLSRAAFVTTEDTEVIGTDLIYPESHKTSWSLWTKFTSNYLSTFFEKLDKPQRLFTIDDVQDFRPFLTKNTWSLERIFCRPSDSRYIVVVKGPGALTRSQFRSSFICSVVGTVMIVLIFVSILVWFELSGVFVLLAFIVVAMLAYASLRNTLTAFKLHKDLVGVRTLKKENKDRDSEEEEIEGDDTIELQPPPAPQTKSERAWALSGQQPSEAVYLVVETKRTTQPTESFCYSMFGFEFLFLFLWPASTLFVISWNVAILFVLVAIITLIRHYINAAVVIIETGDMELVGGKNPMKKWRNKSRLNTIVGSITAGKTRKLWMSTLGVAGFVFLTIFLGAVGSNTDPNAAGLNYLPPQYYYPPQSDDMRYATCTLTNIRGGFGNNVLMMDYIILATLAYTSPELTQPALDAWFGEGVVLDRTDIVEEFRSQNDPENSAVFFKLFTFPDIRLGVISVRGTANNWDMLADSQLWSAAALMQGIRFILPAGEIWTPILNNIVHWINRLQGQSLEKVSFYILTTEFANYLKNDTRFDDVQVTGHSLGGGIAMITGAQAQVPAVGVSGPNALISGRSFSPPVTAEEMNQYTFNIVPNRDIVPMLDDKADQFQYIRCQSEPWDIIGCHYSKRSLCEVSYTCGTGARPAICECYSDFGYPKPLFNESSGERDIFDEICVKPT